MSFRNANTPSAWIAITPSDAAAVDLVGLYVGGAGNVTLVDSRGNTTTFSSVPAGAQIPGRFIQVKATGTTATSIVGAVA